MLEKIYLAKILIEYLDKHTEAKYADFLERIQIVVINDVPPFNEESILRHAPFLCEQVERYDRTAEDGDTLLMTTPCMKTLCEYAGISINPIHL
jgi:hypothetical protein